MKKASGRHRVGLASRLPYFASRGMHPNVGGDSFANRRLPCATQDASHGRRDARATRGTLFRLSAALGLCVTLTATLTANGRDILRPGSGAVPSAQGIATGASSGAVATQARANALDAMARTTRAIQSVQSMQAAARSAAIAGPNNLGVNPNNTAQQLRDVTNGLGPDGLDIAAGATAGSNLWQGANLPVQSASGGQTTVNIKQTSQQAILNWNKFNVGKQTTLNFDQSAGGANKNQWIAFNKISDPSGVPSQILGSIKAEGQVYVINQNGIIFGGSSQVNTHALVASSLPINDNLISRGLLNNPDSQFLFTSLPQAAGSNGTQAFTPPAAPNGKSGDVTVQPGAILSAPTTADHTGGRIALIGPNVTNAGTISTPDGQTILAAGQQVGFAADSAPLPTRRGLDTYVGVVDSTSGTATNTGIIEVARANVTMAGMNVNQQGIISGTTSVSFNGRIDLLANCNAVANPAYNPVSNAGAPQFLFASSGTVTMGQGSVSQILPELSSAETVIGKSLTLPSVINMQAQAIYMASNAMILAPSAMVTLSAGLWNFTGGQSPTSQFVYSGGQIYLDQGASINTAGSTDVSVPVSQNIISVQLRGSELANYPLQRNGALRGQTIMVDIRNTGNYLGVGWVGTPLADATGYANLIQHSVGELTITGGTVTLNAGGSVVMQAGSTINVSGGWISYQGGMVQTTRLISGGHIYDISKATPDRVYDGIYTGQFTATHPKWSLNLTYSNPLSLNGAHYEDSYLKGGSGGSMAITASAVALDGNVFGNTLAGARQLRDLSGSSVLPATSSFSLTFLTQDATSLNYYSSTPPNVVFQDGGDLAPASSFELDSSGSPLPLRKDRATRVFLSPSLIATNGFGNVTIDNSDGNISLPETVSLSAPALGSITLKAANIDVQGRITSPGGSLQFLVYDSTPNPRVQPAEGTPPPTLDPTRGHFTLGASGILSTAGSVADDRTIAPDAGLVPLAIAGGTISISSYGAALSSGSAVNVSGGAKVSPIGKTTYGDAGAIVIKGGQDPGVPSIYGGTVQLNGVLEGFSGAKAGSLSIQASVIQIGGTTNDVATLLLQPAFFSQGGFGSFALTGIGRTQGDESVPGVLIPADTVIAPVVQSWVLRRNSIATSGLVLSPILKPAGERTPVSLKLVATGVKDVTQPSGPPLVRGDFVMEPGAVILTDPKGAVSVGGDTARVDGSIIAPGGKIEVSGKSTTASANQNLGTLPTVDLGPSSLLSTVGTTILSMNPRGYRTGTVIDGGNINVSGNIVAQAGARLDVSGSSDVLSFAPDYTSVTNQRIGSFAGARMVGKRSDSNGGSITLSGTQELFSDATLIGAAGGPSAVGGALTVRSGYVSQTSVPSPLDISLTVTQSDPSIPVPFALGQSAIGKAVLDRQGNAIPALGHITVASFASGGFDSINLKGTVGFSGPVSISARRSISVGDSGVIYADSTASLIAPYIVLGQPFQRPVSPTQPVINVYTDSLGQAFYPAPTNGAGNLTVSAQLIDIGNVSLQTIGQANFIADNGDIRGNGTLDIKGSIYMRAGQIYPPTAVTFTVNAYDYQAGAATQSGSVTIAQSGNRQLPLSAGGTLSIYASVINQGGVLRAPIGTINLGGTGAVDVITNTAVPATRSITLSSGSQTSVSAVDPATGQSLVIPYGVYQDASSWIDPTGTNITSGGAPSKTVKISAASVDFQAGAVIDLKGGGDLSAYWWVAGTGGNTDILASNSSFAVIPGYQSAYAPYAPYASSANFNTVNPVTGTSVTDPGYVNAGLNVGDRVYLGASNGLPAGAYTLLPARYALLSGAFLVTPLGGSPVGSHSVPDGSSLVSGYRFNGLSQSQTSQPLTARFEVAPGTVVNARAKYTDVYAGSTLAQGAALRLPVDSGQLVLNASQALTLRGTVNAQAPSGGRGGLVDISSPVGIFIGGSGADGGSGVLTLDASVLSAFGAESLLIGGVRQTGANGVMVAVNTNNVTVSNAGTPLSGTDVILVANKSLTIAPGSEISASGSLSVPVDSLTLGNSTIPGSGNGTLLRVSSDASAKISRAGVDSSSQPLMKIGDGAQISGASLILDSTSQSDFAPTVFLTGKSITLDSGQISLQLANAPALQTSNGGLVLAGDALLSLQSAQTLSLLSYSSIDIYGTGTVGAPGSANIGLHASDIRGFLAPGGGSAGFTAQNILLDNSASAVLPAPLVASPSGTLALTAGTLLLGVNQVEVDRYANVALNASDSIIFQGSGGLSIQGALTVTAPSITGTKGASRTIVAANALILQSAPVGLAAPVAGLGASLTLQGSSVAVNSAISLPSGVIALHAVNGDVSVGGRLDVGGTAQTFFDLIKYTGGGQISLVSDTGSVNVAAGSTVTVAANPAAGNAGSLSVSATRGAFSAATGTLFALGGTGGLNGTFSLDAGTLPSGSAGAVGATLVAGGFTNSVTIRDRNDIAVLVDGGVKASTFNLSADHGSITVTSAGNIDASGSVGGTISLAASGSVVLLAGSNLTVAGQTFNAAGKGGAISLEAGVETNGNISNQSLGAGPQLDIQSGSKIDLSVASVTGSTAAETSAKTAAAALLGDFTGTLHLRAPQATGNTDLQIRPIVGTITGASAIVIEGYQVFDLTATGGAITNTGSTQAAGGAITATGVNVQGSVKANGVIFGGNRAAISDRLLGSGSALASILVVEPGAEIINTAIASTLPLTLSTAGTSSVTLPNTGGTIVFPTGTPGDDKITSSLGATITSSTGIVTTLAANVATPIPAGSSVSLNSAGTVRFASGTGGAISIALLPGNTATASSTGTTGTVSVAGSSVTLNTSGSAIALSAGTRIIFSGGTPGNDRISSTVPGTITSSAGIVTALAANVPTAIAAGSSIVLSGAGTVRFASGTGGAIPIALASGSFTTAGAIGLTAPTGNLTLGSLTSTTTSDWDFSTYRFGPQNAPGVLTLRSAGNLVFFNALSDGFVSNAYDAALLIPNALLPASAQSWSYRLTAGADFAAADFQKVIPSTTTGSLQLGKDGVGSATTGNTGTKALTKDSVSGHFQVIRTGSGDITISTGGSVQLLNQFATIYTAGTKVGDPTMGGTFDVPPSVSINSSTQGALGATQQTPSYPAQYSFAGGNVTITAAVDIKHQTISQGKLVDDSEKQLPDNWLYRRGYVGTDGQFGRARNVTSGDFASTTWWVDFSNFFEGIGALGGGNVTLSAGRDIRNVDAVVPTNARMPMGVPDAGKLLELGGGDLTVRAGNNIDGGVYYVERGLGMLVAGNQITTNSTRSPSVPGSASSILPAQTWLPTTLFLGKGSFDVTSGGNLLLGPVVNPFLLPPGINNTYNYKTYFSTYAATDEVNVSSLGGSVTLREATTLPGSLQSTPILLAWLQKVALLSATPASVSLSQPWLRLVETSVAPFSALTTLMPPTLRATAFSGDINLVGSINLSPSAQGTAELAATGSINGLQQNGVITLEGTTIQVTTWGSGRVNLSDADPSSIPGIATPLAYQSFFGLTTAARTTSGIFLNSLNNLFAVTGSTQGSAAVLQAKQALHSQGILHAGDTEPALFYAGSGSISGFTVFSAKATRLFAGSDITDVALYLQNVDAGNVSLISAGRDILAYDPNSPLLQAASATGNQITAPASNASAPVFQAGDLEIAGPGTLEIFAGRNLNLGLGTANSDGTGIGIASIGNSRNPYLPSSGADLIVGSGLGLANGLAGSRLDSSAFIYQFLNPATAGSQATRYLPSLGSLIGKDGAGDPEVWSAFKQLPAEQQDSKALDVFYLVLRDAGRDHNDSTSSGYKTYAAGYAAISALFPGNQWHGDISLSSRNIKTTNGGNISIFAPGGALSLGTAVLSPPPGIVTEAGGSISIFTNGSVNVGTQRIFTLRGGDEIIWSSNGDIAAGVSSKTVQSAPPTRVLIDPQSADVKTDLAGLATGGGIGVLASVASVAAANVDLIAPSGTIDAGDAGIRSTGKLSVAATQILNASNIQASGGSTGTPTVSVSAPNLGSLAAGNTQAATTSASNEATRQSAQNSAHPQQEEPPSIITIEVLGYGGD